jgi:hypothetical protein
MAQTNNDNECLYLTFVVDRSGSMMSCGVAVFEGIRGCIVKKAKFAKEHDLQVCLTIFTFDDIIERLEIPSDPTELTKKHYQIIKDGVEPRGWTRLYDTIHQAAIYTTELQEKQGHQTARGFMVILTDGVDNQSDITHGDLKKEIESHQKTGMEYIFIGANINARHTGSALGISPDACMQFSSDPTLTQTAFANLGMALQRSIETDDGEFQFSQMERQTSCTADDRTRFQVDAETDPTFPTMDDILKSKRHVTWPCSQHKNDYDYGIPDILDFDKVKVGADIFNCTKGDDFATGVNNPLNLSFLSGGEKNDAEKKVEDDADDAAKKVEDDAEN